MESNASPKVSYGQRLIPLEIDRQAKDTPDRLLFSFPATNNLKDGFAHVTSSTFANAINRAAWFLESELGKSDTFETVGYLGPNDPRYPIFALALCKTGHKVLFISPRNSIEGDLNVIDKSFCSTWLLPSQHQRYTNLLEIFEARKDMKVIQVPEAADFLNPTPVKQYPYLKTFEQAKGEPIMVLHSSGSTGLPKPITMYHGSLATFDAHRLIGPSNNGFELQMNYYVGARCFCAFPPFHAAGIFFDLNVCIYYESSLVLGGDIPLTLDLIDYVIDYENVDRLAIPPSVITEIVESPSSYARLKKIKSVLSGPPSTKTGVKVAAVTQMDNVLGTTEGVVPPSYRVPAEDWQYMHFHPYNTFEYRDRGAGLYEQVQVRNPKYEIFQGYMRTFPDDNEYSTKDLYAKHPTKEGLWIYRGRADDVIVLSNGEKVNPLDTESKIENHGAVRSALVVGQGKFQTALLIELTDPAPLTEEKKKALIDSLWPIITETNRPAPEHARIQEGFILLSNPLKPFLRAGKGTVQRTATVRLYQPEIDELYENMDHFEYKGELDVTSPDSLKLGLQKICSSLTKAKKSINVENDLFAAGFDSLSVITLVRQLKAILKVHRVDGGRLQPATIYSNPSISALAVIIYNMIHKADTEVSQDDNEKLMHKLFLTYTANLPTSTPTSTPSPIDRYSVILTGSTGSLGSYILERLVRDPAVESIYCLNRSADAQDRQQATSKSNGFNTNFTALAHVKFLHTNLADPKFGLSDSDYFDIQTKATHIIHNQWQVNFNLSLSSFIPHIQGVRNLIDFSIASKHNAEIFFISSIGSVQGKQWDGPVREVVIEDYGCAVMGYGASKLVSELILNDAVVKSGVRGTICRVGQIAGPVEKEEGVWNRWEWFPTIIATSKYLNCLPTLLGSMSRIDWIPVDLLANVILELSLSQSSSSSDATTPSTTVYHTINPTVTTFSSLLPTILTHLGPDTKTSTWTEWVNLLKESAEKNTDEGKAEKNPGVKLLGFFEEMAEVGDEKRQVILETERTKQASKGMRESGGVREEWMGRWLRQWDF